MELNIYHQTVINYLNKSVRRKNNVEWVHHNLKVKCLKKEISICDFHNETKGNR